MGARTSFVALKSTTASTSAIGSDMSLGSWCLASSIALGRPGGSLVDNLYRWVGLPVGILIVGISCSQFSISRVSFSRFGMTSSYREARKGSAQKASQHGGLNCVRHDAPGMPAPAADRSERNGDGCIP